MCFTYNGIHVESKFFYMESETSGLLPQVRERTIQVDDRPGVIFQGKDFDAREFDISGVIVPDDPETLDQCIEDLVKLFDLNTDRPLVFDREDDKFLSCRLRSSISVVSTGIYCKITIPLIAQDPFWYSIETHSETDPISIESLGNYPSSNFIITITGIAVDPSITIGSDTFSYSGSLSGSDHLIMNGTYHTIVFNTANAAKGHNKLFPTIKPGVNNVSISSGSVNIDWHDCWL